MAALFVFSPNLSAQSMAPVSFRGLWIVRESMVSAVEVDRALTFASEAGFNHVFVQVRGRGDAYYNSLIVPRSDRIRDESFDPLGYAVKRGHELGLNVHAWVTTYVLWSARKPPVSSAHLYKMHPEWLEVRADGFEQKSLDLSAPRDGSFEGVYLSPTHPEVNSYLRVIFTEIMLNYAIDGLHLDYVRYNDLDYGYNPAGVREFTAQTGIDPGKISFQNEPSRLNGDADDPMEEWQSYRRQKVTDLVSALHAIITISGKEIMLTAAVKPNLRVARSRYYQDWLQWLEHGIIEYAVLMNYTAVQDLYLSSLRITMENVSSRNRDQIIMGVATYNQSAESTVSKISLARMAGLTGIAVYSYDAHKSDLKHFDPIMRVINKR